MKLGPASSFSNRLWLIAFLSWSQTFDIRISKDDLRILGFTAGYEDLREMFFRV